MLPDFKLILRPNNQVTVTRQRLSQKRQPFYCPLENENHSHSELRLRRYHQKNGIDSYFDTASRKVRLIAQPSTAYGLEPSQREKIFAFLDISSKFQRSDKPALRRGWGATPNIKNFTAKSGQKLRECGAIVDILCQGDLSRTRVVTLTLPSSGDDAYKAISNYSGEITNRLLQLIRRNENEQTKFYYFFVWEHQKRGALHLHLCLHCNREKESERIADKMLSLWRDILGDISTKCGVNLLYSKGLQREVVLSEMQCLNQPLFKSCGAYFSKYAGKTIRAKSNSSERTINDINATKYPPSSFWGSSQNLVKLARSHSFAFKFEGVSDDDSQNERDKVMELLSTKEITQIKTFPFKKEILLNKTDRTSTLTICEGEVEVYYLSPESYSQLLAECRFLYFDRKSSLVNSYAKKSGYERDIFQNATYQNDF